MTNPLSGNKVSVFLFPVLPLDTIADMAYPSIISQPGSAQRNLGPITDNLTPIVEETIAANDSSRILELGSVPYTHITSLAQRWDKVEWWGSCRNQEEIEMTKRDGPSARPTNLRGPEMLDIAEEEHWAKLSTRTVGPFDGVIMLNLIHCMPEGLPEKLFQALSPQTETGRRLLDSHRGWVAAYGAYRNDDGSYKSAGDREFERTHIQVSDPSLGLRTIASITQMAEKWGFVEESRKEVAKGNMFVVWRVKPA